MVTGRGWGQHVEKGTGTGWGLIHTVWGGNGVKSLFPCHSPPLNKCISFLLVSSCD